MKRLFTSLLLLGSLASYSQSPTIYTQPIAAGQQKQEYSPTQFAAANRIAPQASVNYWAGQSILLQPGFEAQAGSVFSASIRTEKTMGNERGNQLSLLAYPNPFGPTTRIEYVLPHSGPVRGMLTTIQGQVIGQPMSLEWQEAGRHELAVSGADLPSGTYIYLLQTGTKQKAIRLIRQP